MNHLENALLPLLIQTTVVATAAVLLYLLAARRGPAAAGFAVTASMAVLALVPLAALVPLPDVGDWELYPSHPTSVSNAPGAASSEASAEGLSLSAIAAAWRDLAAAVRASSDALPSSGWTWGQALGAVLLAGVALGLGRLGLTVWSLSRWLRRSWLVVDVELTRQVEDLRRQMGDMRSVALRECPDLGSPATVGWVRPLILLPSDWRSWTESQRRAVLAHELAHIHRGDYLNGLFARAVVVLYFFHPLVRWLAGRLRLQQELAADALAAPLAGGRREYLVVLAQMALANEARPAAWPVRAFLPTPGTLMRRIAMLRVKDDGKRNRMSWPRQLATVGVLLGVLLIAATVVRSQVGPVPLHLVGFVDSGTVAAPGQPDAAPAPFDLTWVPTNAQGVVGLRPAVLFGQPGWDKTAQMANDFLATIFVREAGLHGQFGVKVEEIEQVTCAVFLQPMHGDELRTTMVFGGLTIRTVKPFDWAKQVKAWFPDATEVKFGDRTYLKAPKSAAKLGPSVCFFVADDRTLVWGLSEAQMEQVLKNPPEPRFPFTDTWKKAATGLAVLAIDNRDKSWAVNMRKTEAESHDMVPLVDAVETVIAAADGFDKGKLAISLTCAGDDAAAGAVKEVEALIARGQAMWAIVAKEKNDPIDPEVIRLWEGLLKQVKVHRQGTEVRVSVEVEGPMTLERLQQLIQGL